MSITSTHFSDMQAPCGQRVDGERLRDRDDDSLISDDMFYACGCKSIRHEYHDGSVSRTVVRHDGTVVVDELFAER